MHEIIANIAEICVKKDVAHAVLSPGSRCAPLTLSFANHPRIKTFTISDERSAAFIGLGIAQQTQAPVVLVCTSGSAAYNYAPAIAEAYFQQIPLIVFTADRPPEWVDQLDGQTIRQSNIFGNHVKKSFELPVSYTHPDDQWYIGRSISEAINISQEYPKGPVHINIPFREPFYPEKGQKISFDTKVKVINQVEGDQCLSPAQWTNLVHEWEKFPKKLIIGGQNHFDNKLFGAVEKFIDLNQVPLISDVITNLHPVKNSIKHHDSFLDVKNEEIGQQLQPDLLITFGLSVISKNIKLLLRKYKPKEHWHIQPAGNVPDTFQSLTKIVRLKPVSFFVEFPIGLNKKVSTEQDRYQKLWLQYEHKAIIQKEAFFNKDKFGEFEVVHEVIKALPDHTKLHLANSMSVRYANFSTLNPEKGTISVFANRGTSGIDGSNSTAYGAAMSTNDPVVLITGDMAFFYDRNAFWNNYLPPNFRAVVINNHAGGIFRIIDGPSRLPELEEFFETKQNLKAESTAKEFGLDYLYCNSFNVLDQTIREFFTMDGKAKLLEIETESKINKEIFENYKSFMKNSKS